MDFPDDDNLLPSDSFDAPFASPLDALDADLVPPSPILTPSQVAFSWSSGSIPVLLYDEAYAAVDADRVAISTSSPESPSVREQDRQAAGTTGLENCHDDGGDNDDNYESIHRVELAAVHVKAFDSPNPGTGSGPSTLWCSSCLNAPTLTTAAGNTASTVSKSPLKSIGDVNLLRMSAIDPVAYQKQRISTQIASGGWHPGMADNTARKPNFGSQNVATASETTPTAKLKIQGSTYEEAGLRAQCPRSANIPDLKGVSRWSADSDSVFLSDSASDLSESLSTHNGGSAIPLNSVNPSIVINSGLPSGSLNTGDPPEDDDDEGPAFGTPTKAPLRPAVSWISSRSWDYGKYEAYVAREEPSRHALISNSLESYIESRSVDQSQVTPPNKRTALGKRDVNALNIDTLRASRVGTTAPMSAAAATGMVMDRDGAHIHNVAKEGSGLRAGSPRRHSPHPIGCVCGPEVQDNSWIADVCVQFLIDQEGFRAAEPNFRYSGMAWVRVGHGHGHGAGSRNTSGAPPPIETHQLAQFRLTKRESYHFHHAPFETPPILRRITVNEDETHDYVSKQALLTLKTNGVYVLHGQEALVPGHGSGYAHGHSEETKLHWKLEYLVDDRIFDASQRVIDGEKVLTLLSFSCSPALLLPSQGKKNTLMHVFKKSVAQKLVAERLQPPGMGAGPGVAGGASGHSSGTGNGASTRIAAASNPKSVSQGHRLAPDIILSSQTHAHITHPRAKTYAWAGLHRKGLSHSVRQRTTHGDLAQKSAVPGQTNIRHRTSPSHGHAQHIASTHQDFGRTGDRQRRNSSASERPSLGGSTIVNAPFNMISSSRHHWEPADPPPLDSADVSPTRHILPPEQLTKLLDSIAVLEDVSEPKVKKVQVGTNATGRYSGETLSSALAGKTDIPIAGVSTSMGFAPLPAPPRLRDHQIVKSMPKDIPLI